MPILGTVASQFSGKSFGSYESIQTVTVGSGGSASVEFTSIPATYTHLQIRLLAEGIPASGSGPVSLDIVLNSDTSSNYAWHRIYGSGSGSGNADNATSTSYTLGGLISFNSSVDNIYGIGVFDILDYANTGKYKTLRSLSGYDANGSGYLAFLSGLWRSTSSINNIKIYTNDRSYTFRQYSQFALYGIKGA
jgi:hypothetical protein